MSLNITLPEEEPDDMEFDDDNRWLPLDEWLQRKKEDDGAHQPSSQN